VPFVLTATLSGKMSILGRLLECFRFVFLFFLSLAFFVPACVPPGGGFSILIERLLVLKLTN
jgi:hypothetical protein